MCPKDGASLKQVAKEQRKETKKEVSDERRTYYEPKDKKGTVGSQ